jgi:signal transduction histidine kinase/CheY-like chemotaxis protein
VEGWGFILVTGAILFVGLSYRMRVGTQAITALASRDRLLDAIGRAIPLGIVVVGNDAAVSFWNAGAARILEPLGGAIGRPLPRPPDGPAEPDWLARARGGEWVRDVAAQVRSAAGAPVDLLVSAGPLEDARGRTLGVIATLTDVTARRVLETHLRRAQKTDALGQVAGAVAHDFRNLLTIIGTVAEGMRGRLPPNDAELQADLDDLIQAVARGSAITRRLLAFTRLEPLEPRATDLRHLANDAAGLLRRLLPAGVDLAVDPGAVPVPALVDPNAMIHVLTNLATNARDAMPHGGQLRIGVRRLSDGTSPSGEVGLIEVSDTGAGMDPATLARAFDPFFTTKPTGVGTGLGLPIIHALVAEQHGTVAVDSAVGRGTTVSLRFPLTPEARGSDAPPPWPGVIRGGTETLLLVEDEEAIRGAAKRGLEQLGYRVLVAGDGHEALKILRGGRGVDLVISDSMMPRLGGAELYERIRESGIRVKFLLASAYTPQETAEAATPRSDIPFLPKPWTLNELTRKVRELLDAA